VNIEAQVARTGTPVDPTTGNVGENGNGVVVAIFTRSSPAKLTSINVLAQVGGLPGTVGLGGVVGTAAHLASVVALVDPAAPRLPWLDGAR
jgi:hypothetical protein